MLSCQLGEMFKLLLNDCSVLDLQYAIPSHSMKQTTVWKTAGFLSEQKLEQSRQEVIQTISVKRNSVAERAVIHNIYLVIKVTSVWKTKSKFTSSKFK